MIPGLELDKLINRRGPDWWDSAILKGSRITVLHEGRVLAEGDMDQVQNDPRVIEVYLGR